MKEQNRLYIKDEVDLKILEDYGFEFNGPNELNWFESYIKHCEGVKYTKVIIFTSDREVEVKYDDDFEYNWFRYEEVVKVKEVKELIENGLTISVSTLD